MAFSGVYNGKLDNKGRVAVPAVFRKELLKDKLKIRKDLYRSCLLLMTAEKWQKELDNIRINYSLYPPEYGQQFKDKSYDIALDAKGRILISYMLRSETGINQEITFKGNETQIEIWKEEEKN